MTSIWRSTSIVEQSLFTESSNFPSALRVFGIRFDFTGEVRLKFEAEFTCLANHPLRRTITQATLIIAAAPRAPSARH
jgi:hypothetical protein